MRHRERQHRDDPPPDRQSGQAPASASIESGPGGTAGRSLTGWRSSISADENSPAAAGTILVHDRVVRRLDSRRIPVDHPEGSGASALGRMVPAIDGHHRDREGIGNRRRLSGNLCVQRNDAIRTYVHPTVGEECRFTSTIATQRGCAN